MFLDSSIFLSKIDIWYRNLTGGFITPDDTGLKNVVLQWYIYKILNLKYKNKLYFFVTSLLNYRIKLMEILFTIKIKDAQNPPVFDHKLGKGVLERIIIDFKGATEEDLKNNPQFNRQFIETINKLKEDWIEVNHEVLSTKVVVDPNELSIDQKVKRNYPESWDYWISEIDGEKVLIRTTFKKDDPDYDDFWVDIKEIRTV